MNTVPNEIATILTNTVIYNDQYTLTFLINNDDYEKHDLFNYIQKNLSNYKAISEKKDGIIRYVDEHIIPQTVNLFRAKQTLIELKF